MNALDLYAKIEPLIGFDAQYERLYEYYCEKLQSLHVKHILDIGCGNGKLLLKLQTNGFIAEGIERSASMVARAKDLGVNVSMQELDAFEDESFDAILAVADVMNYMNEEELSLFLEGIYRVLKKGGYFLGDINTLYGFEEIADGVMVKEEGAYFLAVEATFEKPLLKTNITLFTCKDNTYTKEQGMIMQYFHSLSFLKKAKPFHFLKSYPFRLFSLKEADKIMVLLHKP